MSFRVISVSEKDDAIGVIFTTENINSSGEGNIAETSNKSVNDKDKDCSSEDDFSHSSLCRIM